MKIINCSNQNPIMMSYRLILNLAAFLFVTSSYSCSKSTANEQNIEFEKNIDRVCDSVLSHSKLPGMIVGVWASKTGFAYMKGKGISNLDLKTEMNPEQSFRIGSNTKSFVVTVIMEMADKSELTLEDKLSKYMPTFPNSNKITLRMLANMTSGIVNYSATPEFGDAMDANPMRKWQPSELVQLVWNKDLLFEPGTKMSYSNTNTVILGMIIEQLTHKSLAENIETRFIDRLNLRHTIFPSNNLMPAGGVHGYMDMKNPGAFVDDVTEYYDLSWGWAAGAIISNLNDVKTWVEAMIEGKLLSKDLHEQRFTGLSVPEITYGLGIFTFKDGYWGHNGGLPGYTSVMMHKRDNGNTIIIFYNWQNTQAKPEDLYHEIVKILE